jgi:uncharacterized protein
MKPRLNFITLGVADIGRAKAFYKKLGLTEHGMSNEHVGFFDINGVILSLYGHNALAEDAKLDHQPVPAFRGVSLAWNAGSPSEVDDILAHARKSFGADIQVTFLTLMDICGKWHTIHSSRLMTTSTSNSRET